MKVREIKTVEGFVLDGTPQDILIKGGEVQSLTFWNKRDCSLTILKQSTDKTPLTGAVFHVTDEDGAAIGTNNGRYTSDRNGLITITGLQPGQVVIATEEKAPNGYVRDMTPKTTTIKQGTANSLIFENAHAGSLVINKYSALDRKTPLEGVTFKITTTSGEFLPDENGKISSNGLYYTDEAGQIIINGIVGSLVVTEQDTIPGYVISDANRTQTVEVKPDDTQSLYFYNEPLCSLTIRKLDSVTGKPVPNTEFTLKDGNGNVIGKYTTGKDGTVTVGGLVPGSAVVVTETRVPSGYVLNQVPQTIIVKNGTGNTLTSGSSNGGNNGWSSGNDLTFENDPKTTLTIEKYLETENGNQPLKGVTFLITDSSGAVVGSSNGEYITGEDGRIVIPDLEPGITVTAREIKVPEGVILDTAPKSIRIKTGEGQTLRFVNQRAGTLVIRKLDKITKAPLAGTEFELTYAEGGFVDDANGHLSSKGRYTTNDMGEIRLTVTGTVVAKEITPCPGYVIDSATQIQTVKVNPADTQTITFYNEPLCSLTLTKRDSVTGKPVPNTEFTVKYSDGSLIGKFTTGKDGSVTVTGLIPGSTVAVVETKVPSGYVLDPTPQTIVVKNGSNTLPGGSGGTVTTPGGTTGGSIGNGANGGNNLDFENDPIGTFELIKVDAADKTKRLSGVTFEIREMDDALVETVTTGSDGRVSLTLDAGDYYAVETEAQSGYKLDATRHYFTMKNGENTTLTVENKSFSGIIIHKVNSVTGDGIYDVKFLVYDQNKDPIGEYSTDNEGYIYIDDLTVQGKGKLFIRELEAAPGYELDKEYKTIYVQPGKTVEIEWKNTPITGQFQVYKYAAEYNEVTGTPAGAPLKGAVYEISEVRSGKVVDYITTDARGVAASKPLPLGRYKIVEVTAPPYWKISGTAFDETLEYPGQIIKVSDYSKSS